MSDLLKVLLEILMFPPGMEPFLELVVMFLMFCALCVSLACFVVWYFMARKRVILGYIVKAMVLGAVFWIGAAITNHINLYQKRMQRMIGHYQTVDNNVFLDLRDDYTWTCSYYGLTCAQGIWSHYINDNGDIIDLACDKDHPTTMYLESNERTHATLYINYMTDPVDFEKTVVNDKTGAGL